MSDLFDPLADEIVDALPAWWAHGDPHSELSITIAAVGQLADDLSSAAETIAADQALSTATLGGLQGQWAHLYGVDNEQLSPTTDVLRAYLQARAQDDGSLRALETTLLALLDNGLNVPTPTTSYLVFPEGGEGLEFPGDGSGLLFPDADLQIIEHPTDNYVEVLVRGSLIFDRDAFARACERARLATDLPTVITEF